jgi:hypothetical protein
MKDGFRKLNTALPAVLIGKKNPVIGLYPKSPNALNKRVTQLSLKWKITKLLTEQTG